jgi:hypothetical protein
VYAHSCSFSLLVDEAHINATRVVSGRRFVRWDTVPKLLAQQNMYISGLPYDFFFSKSVLTLGRVAATTVNANTGTMGNGGGAATPATIRHQATGRVPTETSYNLPNGNSTTIATSTAVAAPADRDGERHHIKKSTNLHEEVTVEEDELVDDHDETNDEDGDDEDVDDGDDELDGSSSSNMEVTTPPSSGSPGATAPKRSSSSPSSNTTAPGSTPDFLLAPNGNIAGRCCP